VVYLISNLNWETYKTIPVKLREEFNYRFGEAPKLNVSVICNTLIFIFLILNVLLLSVFLILESDEFEEWTDSIGDLILAAGNILQGALIFFVGIIIIDIIFYYKWFNGRRKWMKEHNIKIEYPLIDKIRKWKNKYLN